MDNKLNEKLSKIGLSLKNNADMLSIMRDDYNLLQKQLQDIENAIIDARITAQQREIKDINAIDSFDAIEEELKAVTL